jgi:putative inorganic carbon (hco3(-)) transporter
VSRTLTLLPFMLLLFVLPFPGTVALRLASLAVSFLVAIALWRRLAPPAIPCKPALLAWMAVALLSLVWAVDPAYSLGEIKNEILYTMMAFVAFFAVTRDEADLRRLLLALAAGALLLCSLALESRMRLGLWNSEGIHGGVSAFAGYAIAVAPMLLLLGSRLAAAWRRAAVFALFLLVAATAFFTLQRIVWWALALQAMIALILLWRRDILKLRAGTLLACVTGVVLLAAGAFLAAQQAKFGTSIGVAAEDIPLGRFRLGPVLHRIAESPIAGAGFGRGILSKAHRDLIPKDNMLLWHAHNVFLNYGLEMGVPGMLVLAWLFVSLLREYWRLYAGQDRVASLLGVAGLTLVAGMLLRNQVNDMFVRDEAILFWALNGMLLGLGRRLRSEKNPDSSLPEHRSSSSRSGS